jgi:hypothetical protein
MSSPEDQPSDMGRRTAAAMVAEALLELPDFLWDEQDLADCAEAAVQALQAAGWRPSPGSNDERTGT